MRILALHLLGRQIHIRIAGLRQLDQRNDAVVDNAYKLTVDVVLYQLFPFVLYGTDALCLDEAVPHQTDRR